MTDESTIRIAVAGVRGKLGRVAFAAFADAPGFRLVGGIAREADSGQGIVDRLEALCERTPQVLLDCTTRPGSVELSMNAVAHGIAVVVGTSGWTPEERAALGDMAAERGIGAMIVPNFSLGAVLMMRLAEQTARFFPTAEIIEMHRIEKRDKPSGTARETADRMVRAGATEPPIHSVRLPGLVAHQKVLFGGKGELLTIRHDSFSYECFVPGMLAAARAVVQRKGLSVGLDSVLDG